jgi:hypothetical protein
MKLHLGEMKDWRKPLAVTATLAACVTVAASQAATAGADGRPAVAGTARHVAGHRTCVSYHYTEVMTKLETNGTPGVDVPAGFESTWLDYLYPFGTRTGQVGTATGNMDIVEKRASDGHGIEYQYELFHLPDGVFTAQSAFDRTSVIDGTWITQPVTGLTGRYQGWSGTWTWRAVPGADPTGVPDFEDKFLICSH